jgi:photosystem II stability/assembly factor-like uncharacterized protein
MLRTQLFIACTTVLAMACKKNTTGGGGGGGGGGGWLVGEAGLMVNIDDGKPQGAYELGSDEQLNAIACRGLTEAWVVGAHGTVLHTADAGDEWEAIAVPTSAPLRALATLDAGPVVVGGDGTFLVTTDGGTSWTDYGDGRTSFRSLAASHGSPRVFAVSDDGGLWTFDAGVLARRTTQPGARAVHEAVAGDVVMMAGRGITRSRNAGTTWEPLAVDPDLVWNDIRVNADGSAVAVGELGAIANVDATGQVSVQYVGDATLRTLHTHHNAIGYAAGDDGVVLITDDVGASWRNGPNVGRTVLGVDEIGLGHR